MKRTHSELETRERSLSHPLRGQTRNEPENGEVSKVSTSVESIMSSKKEPSSTVYISNGV